jgi:4,5-dihydroxyphthalate decarboxylase
MSQLALSLACSDYDRTRPLLDGRVKAEGIDFTPVVLPPPERAGRLPPGSGGVGGET